MMITEAEALKAICSQMESLPEETANLVESLGRSAACDVLATQPLPAFDNSAMDGYAVRARSEHISGH